MTTETVSITHTNDGIRIYWPDGTSDVFANPVYLAESYAIAMRAKERAHKAITEDAAKQLNELERILDDEAGPMSELQKLRDTLLGVAKSLA